jgi:hypothetical protein
MAAIDMRNFSWWDFRMDKGSAVALPRAFSVSGQVLFACRQLTAKPPAVRPIEFASAADNERRSDKPAGDITGPAA